MTGEELKEAYDLMFNKAEEVHCLVIELIENIKNSEGQACRALPCRILLLSDSVACCARGA